MHKITLSVLLSTIFLHIVCNVKHLLKYLTKEGHHKKQMPQPFLNYSSTHSLSDARDRIINADCKRLAEPCFTICVVCIFNIIADIFGNA